MQGVARRVVLTLSKAVEHARGWVATKMGFCDISDEQMSMESK
jgi:hypothetical protein